MKAFLAAISIFIGLVCAACSGPEETPADRTTPDRTSADKTAGAEPLDYRIEMPPRLHAEIERIEKAEDDPGATLFALSRDLKRGTNGWEQNEVLASRVLERAAGKHNHGPAGF